MQLGGAGDVAGGVLAHGAHVQQEGLVEGLDLLGGDQPRGGLRQALDPGDVAGHGVDAHAHQVVPELLGGLLVGRQQHQRPVVGLGVHGPGAEGRDRLPRRDVQRPGHGPGVHLVRGAGVHEGHLAGRQPLRDLLRVELGQGRPLAHDGRAPAVLVLHPAEVERGVRLAVEQLGDEAGLVVGRQVGAPPGVEALVAHRGGGDRAQGLAAGRARAVAGEDLDVVGEGQELLLEAGEHLLRAEEAGVHAAGGLVQQVRTAQVAGEHEVAGEQVARGVGEGAVGDQEGQVLGGVARGVHRGHHDVADADLVAVVQAGGLELVLPVLPALAGDVDVRAGGRGQLAGAGEVVGVDVGLGDGGDLHAVLRGHVPVDVDVAAGVDHQRLAGALAPDEVAGLGEVLVVDALDQHGILLRSMAGDACPEGFPRRPERNDNTPGGIAQVPPGVSSRRGAGAPAGGSGAGGPPRRSRPRGTPSRPASRGPRPPPGRRRPSARAGPRRRAAGPGPR